MTDQKLSLHINSIGFNAVIVIIFTAIISFFLPLDAPAPSQEESAQWLMTKGTPYLFGWFNQVVAMIASSIVLAVAAWQIFPAAPLRAGLVWIMAFSATIIFLLTKFLSLWGIPLMAKAIASASTDAESAKILLQALSPSGGFGLNPTLDFLGFWLYGLCGLFLFLPLFRLTLSAKIAAIALLIYGIGIHLVFVAGQIDILAHTEITGAVLAVSLLLVVACLALMFHFGGRRKSLATAPIDGEAVNG